MLAMQWHSQLHDILNHAKYWQTKSKEENKQVLLYSATVPSWVKGIENELLSTDAEILKFSNSGSHLIPGQNKNIYHYNLEVGHFSNIQNSANVINFVINQLTDLKKTAFEKIVQEKTGQLPTKDSIPVTRTIIFCNTILDCNKLGNLIDDASILHGKMEQPNRRDSLKDFKNGTTPTLVATNVAARGLHIDDVDFVIHYDLPATWVDGFVETYINRSGRSGRAGKSGVSILMHSPQAYGDIADLSKYSGIEFEEFLLPEGLDRSAKGERAVGMGSN